MLTWLPPSGTRPLSEKAGLCSAAMAPRELFQVDFSPDWGYERRFFLDNEHRYAKMHRLLLEHYGDLSGRRIVDLGVARGLLLERFRHYPDSELAGIEIDPKEIDRARGRGLDPLRHFINVFDGDRMT